MSRSRTSILIEVLLHPFGAMKWLQTARRSRMRCDTCEAIMLIHGRKFQGGKVTSAQSTNSYITLWLKYHSVKEDSKSYSLLEHGSESLEIKIRHPGPLQNLSVSYAMITAMMMKKINFQFFILYTPQNHLLFST